MDTSTKPSLHPRTLAYQHLLSRLHEFRSLTALKVMMVLINWIRRDNGLSSPTVHKIYEALSGKVMKRDIRRAIVTLRRNGYIQLVKQGGGRPSASDHKANVWSVLPNKRGEILHLAESPIRGELRSLKEGSFTPPINDIDLEYSLQGEVPAQVDGAESSSDASPVGAAGLEDSAGKRTRRRRGKAA